MELNSFSGVYRGKRVLITGHSGFKGSWLTLWLHRLGAEISGISLPNEANSVHWQSLQLKIEEHLADIRDYSAIESFIAQANPEIIFHLAAQPLVRASYATPLATWSTNVLGTAHVLEAARHCKALRAVVVITTDKCYRNNEWPWGYRETDHLGGHDPYSASKGAAELVCSSYRSSFFQEKGVLLATARAGNVIGGGDWSIDRLIPDLVRAVAAKKDLEIRSPSSTRPWQHVLECLSGYLLLGQKLLNGEKEFAEAWNFGPNEAGNLEVVKLLELLKVHWPKISWHVEDDSGLHEAKLLMLDSAKARTCLGWKPVWEVSEAAAKTASWYKSYHDEKSVLSNEQLETYLKSAASLQLTWAAQD